MPCGDHTEIVYELLFAGFSRLEDAFPSANRGAAPEISKVNTVSRRLSGLEGRLNARAENDVARDGQWMATKSVRVDSVSSETAPPGTLLVGSLLVLLVACSVTLSASDPVGKWKPVNRVHTVAKAIPLQQSYVYQAAPGESPATNAAASVGAVK